MLQDEFDFTTDLNASRGSYGHRGIRVELSKEANGESILARIISNDDEDSVAIALEVMPSGAFSVILLRNGDEQVIELIDESGNIVSP